MKSILLSVQPRWVEKILNGEKAIEVRKSAPKELPFKVYLYCTKGKDGLVYFYNQNNYKTVTETSRWGQGQSINYGSSGNGKVVAEFVVNEVEQFNLRLNRVTPQIHRIGINACLSYDELNAYLNGKNGFALHISDLKIHDEPLELDEFYTECRENANCENCKHYYLVDGGQEFAPVYECEFEQRKPIYRPPQSWQYVRRR